jgi:hypothetical protein
VPILGTIAAGSPAPSAPTIGTATAGDTTASVAFTASSYIGKGTITYTATSSPSGLTATGASSPLTVTGLTNGTAYTFTVVGITNYGVTSATSSSSSPVTPAVPFVARALFAGGWSGTAAQNTVDYVNFSTAGNATDFGDLSTNSQGPLGGVASSTRGVFGGGTNGAGGNVINTIEYFTIATPGNATDFGDLTVPRQDGCGMSSSTRGIFAFGYAVTPTFTDVMEYITIATTGNSTNFGNSSIANGSAGNAGFSSPTRGVSGGGAINGGNNYTNIIEYVTIASTGNATNFGNLTVTRAGPAGASSSTRGLFAAGVQPNGTRENTIDYITIASTGNATDFGDATIARYNTAGTSDSTTALFAGGEGNEPTTTSQQNVIEYVTIAPTGNATDFGDLTVTRGRLDAVSNAHGGLA